MFPYVEKNYIKQTLTERLYWNDSGRRKCNEKGGVILIRIILISSSLFHNKTTFKLKCTSLCFEDLLDGIDFKIINDSPSTNN